MKSLKNTTALLAALSLTLPQGAFAAAHVALDACGDGVEPPCVLDGEYVLVPVEGQGSITIPGLGTTEVKAKDLLECPVEMSTDATPCLTADGEALFSLDGVAMTEMGIESPAEQPAATADAPVESVPAESAAAADGGAAAGVDSGATDTAAEASDEPVGDAETSDAAEASNEPAGQAEVTAETVAPEVAAETVAPEVAAETEITADTATANTDGQTTIAEDTGAKVVEAPESTENSIVAAVREDIGPIIDEPAPSAAAAAAAEGDASTAAEVETEEVTEENSRSADEDFDTSAAGTEAAAVTEADAGGNKGLSNFEKALVLGLGAVVVGQALKNGDQVVSNTGDRVVVRQDNGDLKVLKDDDALLRQPGAQVSTETFADGSTRTTVLREDGTKIVTIRAADGRVVRRARVFEDGSQIVLFDDTEAADAVNVAELPQVEVQTIDLAQTDEDALRRALAAAEAREMDRRFSLRQIRQIEQVRALAPQIELDAITFATGSAAIQPNQAEDLRALGNAMRAMIEERPGEVFLIEGHTDTVGDASYNLALSDRRAETVALALSQYFGVPPENMITQGYGEAQLKIAREGDIRENRRAVIRRITPLLRTASVN